MHDNVSVFKMTKNILTYGDIDQMQKLPSLPDFLNRKINPVNVIELPRSAKRKKKATPPKAKKWNNAVRVQLVLADQAPAIGSGYRTVWAKVGNVWAHLADDYGGRAKISISNFNKLKLI